MAINLYDQDAMLSLFNNRKNVAECLNIIAKYICSQYSDISNDEALSIASSIYPVFGFIRTSLSEIQQGNFDAVIEEQVRKIRFKKFSVESSQEENKGIRLKSTRKMTPWEIVRAALIALISIASLTIYSIKQLRANLKSEEIMNMLADLSENYAAAALSNDTNPQSIVSKNIIKLQDGKIAYDNEGIAQAILNGCTKDPRLLDLYLLKVYSDMDHNRLENMDYVLRNLSIAMKDSPLLQEQYKWLANFNTFLEYVIGRGFADPNNPNYYKLLGAVKHYRELTQETNFGEAFGKLSEEEKRLITQLMKEYSDNKSMLIENLGFITLDASADELGVDSATPIPGGFNR